MGKANAGGGVGDLRKGRGFGITWWEVWNRMEEWICPLCCAACGALPTGVSHHGIFLCEKCEAGTLSVRPPGCPQCARPAPGGPGADSRRMVRAVTRCWDCRRRRPAFECVVAPMCARGAVRELLHQFKYERKRYVLPVLESWILRGIEDPRMRDPPVDLWVPVPLHWSRKWWRGFNQAELLARAVARASGAECASVLRRMHRTKPQARLERAARLVNVRAAVTVAAGTAEKVRNQRVAIVDDVLTTGATVDACARALLGAGAKSVRVLVIARG